LLDIQKQYGYTPVISAQMHYSLLNRELDSEFIPMANHYGAGLIVWSPLSSGFLIGKYSRTNPKPEDARLNIFDLQLFDREKGYSVVDQVTPPFCLSIQYIFEYRILLLSPKIRGTEVYPKIKILLRKTHPGILISIIIEN